MTSRLLRILTTIALLATLLAMGTTTSGASSSALREGRGYGLANGDFVGYYLTSAGTKVYCLSPRKQLPAVITLSATPRYPGLSVAASRQLAYAVQRWGNASTRADAAVESQVLNTIAGNRADVARRARSLPPSFAASVQRHLALARQLTGPYVVSVRLPASLLPGQSALGSVTVVSSAGHPVPGVSVVLSGSASVALPRHVAAGPGGVARFRYRVTDVGTVRVAATAVGLPSTAIQANQPSASEQRMVSWAATTSAYATASFHGSPAGFTSRYSCDDACDGHPVVTLRACAASSDRARRITYHAAGRLLQVAFAPSARRMCRSVSVELADRVRVWAAWQFRTAHGWSRPVVASGAFSVDCPAVPGVTVTMSYDCTVASLRIALGSGPTTLTNASARAMVLLIGGATSRRIVAVHGQQAVFSATASCSAPVTYTMQAGVQRANGSYHYGALASVTTPHR